MATRRQDETGRDRDELAPSAPASGVGISCASSARRWPRTGRCDSSTAGDFAEGGTGTSTIHELPAVWTTLNRKLPSSNRSSRQSELFGARQPQGSPYHFGAISVS